MKLPHLPVPDLNETLERYLLCVKPLVPEVQFEKTKRIVEKFGADGGMGEILQRHILKKAKNVINWSYDWWLEDMYLVNRAPLPVNSNPGMVLPSRNYKSETEWLRFSAKLVSGIIDYKEILDNKELPVDIANGQLAGQPLCMQQYYRLFSSCRIPGKDCDKLMSISHQQKHRGHLVVAFKNEFYILHVAEKNGERIAEDDIFQQLRAIVEEKHGSSAPVGVLTSLGRSEWADARNHLIQNPVNRASISAIEHSIAVLCLDQPCRLEPNDVNLGHQMLHGGKNSYNRWYDKTIQFIVGSDGAFGLVYEHSEAEGIAVISLVEHIVKHTANSDLNHEVFPTKSTLTPERLEWEIDSMKLKSYLDLARTALLKMSNNLDLKILRFSEYGKEFIKRQNISPDAFIQVALQLSFFKIYGHLVSTYESASTRRFREGRVDNIRASTVQALEFAKSLTNESGQVVLNARNMMLLRRAAKAQTDYTIAAITGHAVDCHLVGLREAARELKFPIPDIFTDPSYDICNYFTLSTSQVPTTSESFMCYGAVVEDGYGVSYNPHSDEITFCVASFRSCPSTSSDQFVIAITESFRVMRDLCRQWNRRRSSSLGNESHSESISSHPHESPHYTDDFHTIASSKRFVSETSVVPRKQAINREMSTRSYSVDSDDLRRRVASMGVKEHNRHTIDALPEEFESGDSRKTNGMRPSRRNQYLYSKRRSGGVLVREKMHSALSRRFSSDHLFHPKPISEPEVDNTAESDEIASNRQHH